MVAVMVTNKTLNNSNGDKKRKIEKEEKCITKCSKNGRGGVVTNGEVQKGTNNQTDDGRTNERNDG